jgi:2',3'-cyclic-nucleotide 2'-phosphodiesterase (5'-nucleotidase family)
MNKKILIILTALLFTFQLSIGQNTDSRKTNMKKAFTSGSTVKEINILHWNDFHAKNTPYKYSPKNGDPYNIGGTSGVLGYLNKFRNKNSLVLHAGDDFQGTPISSITRGKSQIELLNLYNLDAFEIGNHEFDYGIDALDSDLMLANFNYLCGNVLSEYTNSTFGKPFLIKDVEGVKVGIIGLAPDDLFGLVVVSNVKGLRMLNTDSILVADIAYLKNQKCNLIVLLSHEGFDKDVKLAEKYYGDVDIIVGGHSHTALSKPKVVNGVLIVQAGHSGRYLGKLDLKVDTQKDTVVSYSGELIETKEDPAINDANAKQIVDNMLAETDKELSRVIAVLEVDWTRGRTKESNMGQYIADATRIKTNTDVCFLNSGGIRKDLPKGNVTLKDIWEISPFGNTINVVNVSGKTLLQMIRNNIKQRVQENPGETPDLLIVSGILIEYDLSKAKTGADDFLVSVKVGGAEVSEEKTYSISTNNYMAGQFKKFFGDVEETINFTDTNLIDRDIIIEQVENSKVINNLPEERIKDISK